MSLIHTPVPAFKPETDAPFVPEAPFKLGKQEHPSHALLYKDRGSAEDVLSPFAIVYSTTELIMAPFGQMVRRAVQDSATPTDTKNARIGQITARILPSQFYTAVFANIEEAVEQVEYFFSLSETQQLVQLQTGNFGRNLMQDVRFAVSDYNKAFESIVITEKDWDNDIVQVIAPASQLLKSLALLVSPFKPTCSAFFDSSSPCSVGHLTLRWHVQSLQKAIDNLIVADKEPCSPKWKSIAYGGLQHAISNIADEVARPSAETNEPIGYVPSQRPW